MAWPVPNQYGVYDKTQAVRHIFEDSRIKVVACLLQVAPEIWTELDMATDERKELNRKRFFIATDNAKKVLKKGDKIRVTKCPGTKRTIIFDHWNGNRIVSKSGIDDYAASTIDRLNGEPVCFYT